MDDYLEKYNNLYTDITLALKILNDRKNYWMNNNMFSAMAYDSAYSIVEAALNNNIEILHQYDCYGEDK